MKRPRIAASCAAVALLLGALDTAAFFVAPRKPGGRLAMNSNMGATPLDLIDGQVSWNQVIQAAMGAWNEVGIGPGLDRSFFSLRSPAVSGDPCEFDRVNEVRFTADNCGEAFGTAVAITRSWVRNGIVEEADMIFDNSRTWDSYEGVQRLTTGGARLYDLYRVAVHELGHAAGLDHPDEHGQTVPAIMNSRVSNTDRLQPDDIEGARAIQWGSAATPPPAQARFASTIGTRGVVTGARPIYGAFTLASTTSVMIAVRGPSLQTLGITQDPLDSPTLRVYDAAGNDLLFGTTGVRGVTSCPVVGNTAAYYANERGTPLHARDSCDSRTLAAGSYTFTITPSTDAEGEALFEVLLNPRDSGSAPLQTLGSRGTVTRTATMFGGFTLDGPATVDVAVRGPSLQTLGITSNPLDSPMLRIYNAAGADLLFDSRGDAGVFACSSAHPTAVRYANAGQALNARDACASLTLAAGTYTFNIVPGAFDSNGEVLFEVTLR